MSAPSCARICFGALKRAKITAPTTIAGVRHRSNALEVHVVSEGIDIVEEARKRSIEIPSSKPNYDAETQRQIDELQEPSNLAAIRLQPLRRQPTHGIPVCDLQLRTYYSRNMDLFADFALRAAYYLGLPAKGPIPLPRITERWTVPRSNFAHKKSQENFERVTMRRLIQIQDGNPEVVRIWLGILMKYQYHGVGMKANVWEHDNLDAAKELDQAMQNSRTKLDELWLDYGTRADRVSSRKIQEILRHPPHVGVLAEWEKEQGVERGQFQEAIKKRKADEDRPAWEGRRARETSRDSEDVKQIAELLKEAKEDLAKDPVPEETFKDFPASEAISANGEIGMPVDEGDPKNPKL